jgi:hypothetical protein
LYFDDTVVHYPEKWNGTTSTHMEVGEQKQAAVESYRGLTQ